jgi:hypothetical protein
VSLNHLPELKIVEGIATLQLSHELTHNTIEYTTNAEYIQKGIHCNQQQ